MLTDRRTFLRAVFAATAGGLSLRPLVARARGSTVVLQQLSYAGGNWQPRPSALRRLTWELHKRTAVDAGLEPTDIKASAQSLAVSPFVYLSGDRPFTEWKGPAVDALSRFLKLGGTLVVDPAISTGSNTKDFDASVDQLIAAILPSKPARPIPQTHVLYRAFYQIARPVGRVEGPAALFAHDIDNRLAIIRTAHDLGGAWAKDNLGNWEHEVAPGGETQRENAIRLGVNLVLYSLCLDYKDEQPHLRFGRDNEAPEGQ